MIWLKRLAPILLIAVAWFGYNLGSGLYRQAREREECRIALVTAQVWVATAKYRDDAERLLNYRDSLLAANGLSKEQMFEYVQRSKGESEGLLPFTQRLRELVDSLARIEDSLLKGTPEPVIDSVSAADSAQAER